MRIVHISLENFRGYDRLFWQPHPRINIIAGGNAQGKTNLLEAIFFGFTGHSFRTHRDKDLIRWGSNYCRVEVKFESHQQERNKIILLTTAGKKQVKSGGQPDEKSPFMLPLIFTPDHLLMIKGSPVLRRRWLDLEIGPLEPGYPFWLHRYQKVLLNRNKLLQKMKTEQLKQEELEPWNQQLAAIGARIIAWRCRLLAGLSSAVRSIYSQIGGSGEKAGLVYLSTVQLERAAGEKEIYQRFLEGLSRCYTSELVRGQTLIGPHRDDLFVSINGQDARRFGSQGQQRTLVLALKLAQLELSRQLAGDYPIVLLDDVFSELDQKRRLKLVEYIRGKTQVFITTSTEDRNDLPGPAVTVREHRLYKGG